MFAVARHRVCRLLLALTLAGAGLSACGRDAQTDEAKGQAYLDQGNTAYRAKQYDKALGLYRKATRFESTGGAGYFGMYMVYTVEGRTAEADEAFGKARELSPALGQAQHPLPGSGGAGVHGGPMTGMSGLDALADSTGASGGPPPPPTRTDGGWLRRSGDSTTRN